MRRYLWPLVVFALIGCGSGPDPVVEEPSPLWFVDVAKELGVDVVQTPGTFHIPGAGERPYHMCRIYGTGLAVFDFDGDGLLDLLILQGGGAGGKKASLLKQLPDGKFKDVSAGSGLDVLGHCLGVAVGDFDNDGKPDVAISLYQGLKLFRNRGAGVFEDVTVAAGLPAKYPFWGVSLSFFDFDRDGRLDLFVANSLGYDPTADCRNQPDGKQDFCGPKGTPGQVSKLFRNLGGGKFQDVSKASGIESKAGPGLGVVCADFTGDGWPDVFVANDGRPNHLWVNKKNGTFEEEAVARGLAVNAMGVAEGNMGIIWADVDGDGFQDVFVTHLDYETNTVWRQEPASPGFFADWTAKSRMNKPKWKATGFGTVGGDFDNDGHVDAAIVNGAVNNHKPPSAASRLDPFWARYGQHNQLFANDGKGGFNDVSIGSPDFTGHDNVGRTLATGDLHNDGRLWLVASAISSPIQVLKNVAKRGNWVGLRLFDAALKRDALGAEVRLSAGGRVRVRTAHTGGSYLVSNDPRVHFGLGEAAEAEWAEVRWPDGGLEWERFPIGAVNRHVTLTRGKGSKGK